MHRIRYGDPDVNVYGWADPTTGVVWETVYPKRGKAADCTMVCVFDADTTGAHLTADPYWFGVQLRGTMPKLDADDGYDQSIYRGHAVNWGQYDGCCLDCDGPAPHVRLSYCDACLPACDYDPDPF